MIEVNEAPPITWPKWDVFIAHSSEDYEMASALFVSPGLKSHTIFLDAKDIPIGTDWDEVLQKAQSDSLITVALLSPESRRSHFTREEIHTGIKMARRNPAQHKLIPVYLGVMPVEPEDFFYGLGLIQGVDLRKIGGIDALAQLLSRLIDEMKSGNTNALSTGSRPMHTLNEYPLGPLVEPNLIKKTIIETYARLIPLAERRLVVSEANNFRLEADPGTPYTIRLHMIQSADNVPAFTFWMDVFDYARLQGPRMLAALLLVVPDDMWDNRSKNDRQTLLNSLRSFNH